MKVIDTAWMESQFLFRKLPFVLGTGEKEMIGSGRSEGAATDLIAGESNTRDNSKNIERQETE